MRRATYHYGPYWSTSIEDWTWYDVFAVIRQERENAREILDMHLGGYGIASTRLSKCCGAELQRYLRPAYEALSLFVDDLVASDPWLLT